MELTASQKKRLYELECVLSEHMEEFVRVGLALREIRDDKLYKAEFDTFEAYCKGRWEIGDRYARRLIDAAELRMKLPQKVGPGGPVWTEKSVRELTRLPTSIKAVVMAKHFVDTLGDGGKIAASAIRKLVNQELGVVPQKKSRDEAKIKLLDYLVRWKGRLEAFAEHLEALPQDAMQIIREEDPYVMKNIAELGMRIAKRLDSVVQGPRVRRKANS